MNLHPSGFTHRLFWLGLTVLLLPAIGRAQDATFAVIQTKTGVYSNVTVTTKSADYIVIQHAAGLTSLKATELPPEVQQKLGYGPAKSAGGTLTVTAKARALVGAIPAEKIEQVWNKYAPAGMPELKLNATVLGIALGVLAVSYFGFCICGIMICHKVGRPAGLLMWIPVVQFVPLFRAAKMSPLCLVALLVPLLNIWIHILWSFRIAGARGLGFWTALFLVLPTYPLAFAYLAFAPSAPPPEEELPPEKFKAVSHVLEAS